MANFVDLAFADGEYRFRLPLAQIAELQRKCGAGIAEIYGRVLAGAYIGDDGRVILNPGEGRFHALDLIETVRHGLIGGKQGSVNGQPVTVTPPDANRLIESYLIDQPLLVAWELAFSILGAVIMGFEPPKEDAEGNGQAAAEETPSEDQSSSITP